MVNMQLSASLRIDNRVQNDLNDWNYWNVWNVHTLTEPPELGDPLIHRGVSGEKSAATVAACSAYPV